MKSLLLLIGVLACSGLACSAAPSDDDSGSNGESAATAARDPQAGQRWDDLEGERLVLKGAIEIAANATSAPLGTSSEGECHIQLDKARTASFTVPARSTVWIAAASAGKILVSDSEGSSAPFSIRCTGPEPLSSVQVRGLLSGWTYVHPASEASAKQLVKQRGCLACHAVDKKLVGPSFNEVSARYANDAKAFSRLMPKMRDGGSGKWGQVPMPPDPDTTEADRAQLISWILALNDR